MRPLILKGHERNLTCIRYSQEGDLLFSSAKDPNPCVWYTATGERLGTYSGGHNGAVFCIDVNYDTSKVVTTAGDFKTILWDCRLGKTLAVFELSSIGHCCAFSYSSNLIFSSNDSKMGQEGSLFVYDIRQSATAPVRSWNVKALAMGDISSAAWNYLDFEIVTGHVDGRLNKWDLRAAGDQPAIKIRPHDSEIRDIKVNSNHSMLLTGSADNMACLFDANTLDKKKTYPTQKPVNSVAISPTRPHIICAGGTEAQKVTTTAHSEGGFEVHFFHLYYEEEFAQVADHFGPVNCLEFHPNGESYTSGGEDGLIRLHNFDEDYLMLSNDLN